MIDWTDFNCPVTAHFKVSDCLWLGQWARLANAYDGLTEQIEARLLSVCTAAEQVRSMLGVPMLTTSMYRPPTYSPLVGGSATDVHTQGMAMDFIPGKMTTDQAKAIIMPAMEQLSIRMEDNGTNASWIHIDVAPVGHKRFFLP
jgi:zinc D-Ala-D-Ala carboxypeptidase